MASTLSQEHAPAVPWFVNKIAIIILRSPLHGLLSQNTLLLSFKGRKSGKTYTILLSYVCEENMVVCFTYRSGKWWKNLTGGVPVTVNLRGLRQSGFAEAVADDQALIEREMEAFLLKAPRDAPYKGVRLDANGQPEHADITRSARLAVLLYIQITPHQD